MLNFPLKKYDTPFDPLHLEDFFDLCRKGKVFHGRDRHQK